MVDRPNIEEVNLKTFNSAKLYSEQVLFPMLENYQKFMRQSDWGVDNLNDSSLLPEEIRNVERFNGLKGSVDVLFNLINTIRSTVILKNNKEEFNKMNEVIETLEKIKLLFYDNKERFFSSIYRGQLNVEIINRE